MSFQCKICNNSVNNEEFIVREMMYGTRENFTYFKCSFCGCLQISKSPKEMSKYYPREDYYSYQGVAYKDTRCSRIKNKIKPILFDIYINAKHPFLLRKLPFIRTLVVLEWLKMLIQQKAIKRQMAVLDVGCGIGHLLQTMNIWGFKNLTGVDPFIEKDILYPSGIKIHKQDVFNITGMYDLMMLHHSFEHMDNPRLVLKQLYNMLNVGGHLLIRVPVSDSFAWRKYGVNWFQIDAPRHFFLYTTKSLLLLGKEAGFIMKQVVYDSTEYQFLYSEKYCRDMSLLEKLEFSPEYIQNCKKQAKLLDQIMDGDQACFLFQKTE
jgi:2-polyprenyl-3-methyl-5-hydroxy-6-metoxy-1,4-benzoquinol methylase